jgi:phosphonate transport system substrate-binding protein
MSQPKPSFSWPSFLTLAAVLVLPVLAYIGWEYFRVEEPEPVDYAQVLTGYLKRGGPVGKLGSKFTDANGDLVADPPTDPGQFVDPAELVMAPIAGPDPDAESVWKELLAALAKATGKPVKFEQFDEPRAQLSRLGDDTLHVTVFNTGSVPEAVNVGGFQPIAALATADGVTTYEMEVIVPADSAAKSLADLKGHAQTLVLASPGSHSGYKAPLILLRDEFSLVPGRDFDFVIGGGHRQSIARVAKGGNFVAPVANDILVEAVTSGQLKPDQFRSIYKSKPFPKAALGTCRRLKPELAAKVREAVLTFDFTGTQLEQKYRGTKAVKFAPVDYKRDWEFVRTIDEKMLAW